MWPFKRKKKDETPWAIIPGKTLRVGIDIGMDDKTHSTYFTWGPSSPRKVPEKIHTDSWRWDPYSIHSRYRPEHYDFYQWYNIRKPMINLDDHTFVHEKFVESYDPYYGGHIKRKSAVVGVDISVARQYADQKVQEKTAQLQAALEQAQRETQAWRLRSGEKENLLMQCAAAANVPSYPPNNIPDAIRRSVGMDKSYKTTIKLDAWLGPNGQIRVTPCE